MSQLTNGVSLEFLAGVANAAAEKAESDLRSAVTSAIEAGQALLAAKKLCAHGQWLPWLEANWRYTRQLAHRYMTIANVNHELHLESASSIREALRMIADEREEDLGEPIDLSGAIAGADDDYERQPHVTRNSGNNEWYTPREIIELARRAMGGIDLDPASTDAANELVRAKQYFTAEDDGLRQDWAGRVWLNPPYSKGLIDRFAERLVAYWQSGDVTQAIVLVNNSTDANWFQQMADACSAICFTRGRVIFLNAEGQEENRPLQGQALLYFGDRHGRFVDHFKALGSCWIAS